jgi:hypothetical protein
MCIAFLRPAHGNAKVGQGILRHFTFFLGLKGGRMGGAIGEEPCGRGHGFTPDE